METEITCAHTQNNFSHSLFSVLYSKLVRKLRGTIKYPVSTDLSAFQTTKQASTLLSNYFGTDWSIRSGAGKWKKRGGKNSFQHFKDKIMTFWKTEGRKKFNILKEGLKPPHTLNKKNLLGKSCFFPEKKNKFNPFGD